MTVKIIIADSAEEAIKVYKELGVVVFVPKKEDELFVCDKCKASYKSKEWYEKHIESCTGKKLSYYQRKRVVTPQHLEQMSKDNAYMERMRREEDPKTFLCTMCFENRVKKKGSMCESCEEHIESRGKK